MEHLMSLDDLLDECLEAIRDEGRTIEDCLSRHPEQREALEPLLRVAVRLHDAGSTVHPSAAFQAQAPARLQALLRASSRPPVPRAVPHGPLDAAVRFLSSVPVWQPIVVGVVLAAILAAGILIPAADRAVPGDPLYPLDIALEQVHLALTRNQEAALRLRLDLAAERLQEAEALIAAGDTEHLAAALEGYSGIMIIAGESVQTEGQAALLNDTQASYQQRLEQLRETLPEDMQPAVDSVLGVSSGSEAPEQNIPPAPVPQPTPVLTEMPASAPAAAASPTPAGERAEICAHRDTPHPHVAGLADTYGVSYAEILFWFCDQGYGLGTIDLAYSLSAKSGVPVDEIFAMQQSGMSWGAIAAELKARVEQERDHGQGPDGHGPDQRGQGGDNQGGHSGDDHGRGNDNRPPDDEGNETPEPGG